MKISRTFFRFFLLCFMTAWFGLLAYPSLAMLLILFAGEAAEALPFLAVLFVFYLIGWTMFGSMLRQCPVIILDEDGVRERVLFVSRSYRWQELKQAGVLWQCGRGCFYNEIILLKPGGSPRRYKDKTFVIRNAGNLIHIPYSEAAREYVRKHYGPLDFDLYNGQPEQSTVIE